MLRRSIGDQRKKTYQNATMCDEWMYYDNFYDWLHSQDNYDKWINLPYRNVDKDIIYKNNKLYSPNTCCLVPQNVNTLFTKTNAKRGLYPIGVYFRKDVGKFVAQCENPKRGCQDLCGFFDNPEDAFYFGYKPYKERIIKEVASEEYQIGNIDTRCYEAMMNYVVEITD